MLRDHSPCADTRRGAGDLGHAWQPGWAVRSGTRDLRRVGPSAVMRLLPQSAESKLRSFDRAGLACRCDRCPASRLPGVHSRRRDARVPLASTDVAASRCRCTRPDQHHDQVRLSSHDLGAISPTRRRPAALHERLRRPLPHRQDLSTRLRVGRASPLRRVRRDLVRIHLPRSRTASRSSPICLRGSLHARDRAEFMAVGRAVAGRDGGH